MFEPTIHVKTAPRECESGTPDAPDSRDGRDHQSCVVGRLAPSPTGGLHLGHADTFLIAWLAARHAGGRVILRIEDLDRTRARAAAAQTAIEDLRGWDWIGMRDPTSVGQGRFLFSRSEPNFMNRCSKASRRARAFIRARARGRMLRAAALPHADDEEGPAYPGTCAHRCAADAAALGDRPFSWRFACRRG